MRNLLLLSGLFLMLGCGGATPAATENAATASGAETPALVLGGPPQITLLDEGTEPRTPLRYRFSAGTSFRTNVEMHMTMGISLDGQEVPMPGLPATRARVKCDVVTVDPAGNAHIAFSIEEMSVVDRDQYDPNLVSMIEETFQNFGAVQGSEDLSARGVASNARIELGENADPNIRAMLEDMRKSISEITTILPEEPVGVGARWQARAKVNLRGIPVDQTTLFVLNARDADTANLHLVIEQEAHDAAMELPNLPPEVEARVDSLQSNGSGDVLLAFATLSPTSDLTMHATMNAHITQGAQTQAMGMRLDVVSRYFPAEP